MSYSKTVNSRIKKSIFLWKGVESKKMFDGVFHLLNGKMFCGVKKDYLILRLSHEEAEIILKEKHTKSFEFMDKPMRGWVVVSPEGFKTEKDLKRWLNMAKNFVKTLPEQ